MFEELWISIVLAGVCVLVSAFCSGTEVALFSLRRVDREQLAKSTFATDRLIVRLLERPRRLIATVLIGNEACTAILAVIALGFTCRACESALAAFGLALAITLPLVVLITEVTAKTLAAKVPLGWARACSPLLALFALVITPVRVVIAFASEVILRPLGAGARTRPARDLSEEEFRHLVDAGSAQGQVDARERRLIHRVFEFSDKNVGQVMTPRERIFAVSLDGPQSRVVKDIAARGFSRIPVYQKTLDNIRGVLNAKDLVRAAGGQPIGRRIAELVADPLFVPRTTPVKRLFLTFKQKKVHMAIVVSEYGKVLGLVTMDDLLAQIFGVLRDERAAMQSRPRTPATGSPAGVVPMADDGRGGREDGSALDESRPVPREVLDEVSRPITDPGIAAALAMSDSGPAAPAEGSETLDEGGGTKRATTAPAAGESGAFGHQRDSVVVIPTDELAALSARDDDSGPHGDDDAVGEDAPWTSSSGASDDDVVVSRPPADKPRRRSRNDDPAVVASDDPSTSGRRRRASADPDDAASGRGDADDAASSGRRRRASADPDDAASSGRRRRASHDPDDGSSSGRRRRTSLDPETRLATSLYDDDANEPSGPNPTFDSDEDPNAVSPPPPPFGEHDDLPPPTVDVDLISSALGGITDRQMAGLPSRTQTQTLSPLTVAHHPPDDDDDEIADSPSGSMSGAKSGKRTMPPPYKKDEPS